MRGAKPIPPKILIREVSKVFKRIQRKGKIKSFLGGSESATELEALQNVGFTVNDSEFVAIVGPSGCGKTTLLRIVDGLVEPDSGEIIIDGDAVSGPGPDRAFVFQHFGLFPWRTVLDNVAADCEFLGMPKEARYSKARSYIELVGLRAFENYYPHELSGGMQQRVGLARALATNPEIILMDEPFGSLDMITKRLLQEELLKILEKDRKTIMYVTHDLDEALVLSDRVVVMSGRPGTILAVLEVDLPRPRGGYAVTGNPRFIDLKNQIWEMIRKEAMRV